MKKILSMILVCAMLLAVLPAGYVFADDAVAVAVDTVIAAPADTSVDVFIRMTADPHWAALEMTITFDASSLTYKGFRRNPALDAQAAAGETMMYTVNEESADAGSVGVYFTTAGFSGGYFGYNPDGYDYFGILTFDVAGTAPAGLSAVSVSVDSLTNFEGDNVPFTVAAGGINVTPCEHDWQITAHAEVDCENDGFTDYECSICHATKHVDVPARGHHWNELERVEPTTDTEGYVTYECVWCGKTRTEILAILPPTEGLRVRVEKVAATAGSEYVEMKLYIDDMPRWSSISVVLTFDADVLTYEDFTVNSALSKQLRTGKPVIFTTNDEKADEGELRILLASAYELDGYEGYHSGGYDYLGTLEFDVDAAAAAGLSVIEVEVTKLTNSASVDVPFETVNGGVQVICVHDWVEVERVEYCEEEGHVVYECSKCGELKREDVDPIGHAWGEWEVTTPATCTEGAIETRVCANDPAHTETRDGEAALGHDWGEWAVTTEPTCTAAGEETKTCSRCGAAETRAVDALGHDYVAVVTEPTCTEDGFTTYTCSRCGDTYTADETDALGHEWSKWAVTREADCTATGEEARSCSRCGEIETRAIPIDPDAHNWILIGSQDSTCSAAGWIEYVCANNTDHTKREEIQINPEAHAWGEWAVTTPATCTEDAVETRVCAHDPSHIETRKGEAALGHDWGKWAVTTEPTCTADGEEERACTRCGETETRVIDMDPDAHAWGEWEVTTPATCTEGAIETRVCANDPAHIETRDGEAALGHDYVAVVTEPTCTEGGFTTYTCSRCGDTYVTDETDALGHDFGEWAVTKEASCEEAGEETRTCSRCGGIETREIESIGHDWGEWTVTKTPTFYSVGEETRICANDPAHIETRDIPRYLKGDMDFDGKVTVADALTVLRVAAKLAPETELVLAVADTDRDGEITVADALNVLRRSVKLISEEDWLRVS